MKLSGKLALSVLLAGVAGAALAQQDVREVESGVPDIRLFMEHVASSGDPVAAVEAARRTAQARFGRPVGNAAPRTMAAEGHVIASLSDRFEKQPEIVHSWMASDNSTAICYIVAPGRKDMIGPFATVIKKCGAILLGQDGGVSASTGGGMPPAAMMKHGAVAPPPPPSAMARGGVGEAGLKGALAAIPQESRPVAIVLRNGTSFNGMFVMPKPEAWMILPGGFATDCFKWDPGSVTPTPDMLRAPPYKCAVARWRKGAGGYEFQTDKGAWEKQAPSNLIPFRPGQRITVDLENKSGFGTPVSTAGLAVNTLSSGQLRMTSDGQIAVGSWTSVVVSGANVGGGSTGRKGPAAGSYYLDGYLIAIADGRGGIRRGFIAADNGKGGPYIYLNGELFWPKEH